ncbi:MAG: pilus assembly protein PilB [Stigonema ocellatum SAG 48.90 = DSM 106950]|nr:pilus assembly protein PilB [Stigonema ocellatum SAG 48.90 = DSM 106950]
MLSSEGKSTGTEAISRQVLSATQTQWEQGLDREQIFQLIENILSFEACLYHQILPFRLEDNNLLLGMVNPQDSAALDYLSHILSYMNYIMVTQLITADTHRIILSAYLNYKNTFMPCAKEAVKPLATLAQDKGWEPGTISSPAPPASLYGEIFIRGKEGGDNDATSFSKIAVLQLPLPEKFSPMEGLAILPPKKLLQELLGRVLAGGIGRLYLERRPYHGRILWSENGVLQSVLETLPLSVFQGVLNELKRFASLPVTTLTEPKQVEKECLYQQKRLLLRLRVMPGMYGEEGTLQVLRGAALKFYQQQQLARLSRDALGISQQLSYKLHELQERLLVNQDVNSGGLEAFTALSQLLDTLDNQIKILMEASEQPTRLV